MNAPTFHQPMKAITLHQPWASLISFGAKHIETRSWYSPYRGPLAIHAGRVSDRETTLMVLNDPLVSDYLNRNAIEWWNFPTGSIVAVVNMVDCRPTEDLIHNIDDLEFACGNFSRRRFGFVFEDIELVDPDVRCRGWQKLWNVPEQIVERIKTIPHFCE